jgi:transposase
MVRCETAPVFVDTSDMTETGVHGPKKEVPALRQSGKDKGSHAGISHLGNAALRTALRMPTLTAVRKNAWLKAYYERLRARGKLPKVALIAAMRKQLHAVYSVAKNRRPFTPHLVAAVEVPL